MPLITRHYLEQKLNELLSKQMVSVSNYRNGDLPLSRLRATINRVHKDMVREIDRTHERTKTVALKHNAQTHKDTNAHKGAVTKKRGKAGLGDGFM